MRLQLIVMPSLSSAVSSFIFGSVAREVFRTERYPVWVCGPKALVEMMPEKLAENSADGLAGIPNSNYMPLT